MRVQWYMIYCSSNQKGKASKREIFFFFISRALNPTFLLFLYFSLAHLYLRLQSVSQNFVSTFLSYQIAQSLVAIPRTFSFFNFLYQKITQNFLPKTPSTVFNSSFNFLLKLWRQLNVDHSQTTRAR